MSDDLRQRLISRLEDEYGQLAGEQAVDAILDELQQHEAEALADQTLMRGLTVQDGGINLDLIPPREIAAIWVHCAVEMLGDAPNYTETEVKMPSVSMEISPAGTLDRYALIVQRVGKLTPHEARQQAESERDAWRERAEKAEAAVASVRHVRDTWLANAATTDNITIRNWHELFAEDLEAALDGPKEAEDGR